MIEPEMAFTDLTGNMDLAEEIVKLSASRMFARNVRKSWDFREICRQGTARSTGFRIGTPFPENYLHRRQLNC